MHATHIGQKKTKRLLLRASFGRPWQHELHHTCQL